ncbi:uncharacterized protein TNCV_2965891 [Trichonephila clavipes]|nr:uncharacterized protein TNCV_2965891 [Trichonephila clavipes]
MNLLNGKELLVIEKESLSADLWPLSKVFSIFEAVRVFFFSEKMNFSLLVRLQSKLHFCYSPYQSVIYSKVTSDLSHGNPRVSLDSIFDGLTIP